MLRMPMVETEIWRFCSRGQREMQWMRVGWVEGENRGGGEQMKMICNKAGTCEREECRGTYKHDREPSCRERCEFDKDARCVPVRQKRKPVTVWVTFGTKRNSQYTMSWLTRREARKDVHDLRVHGWQMRGPVKVSIP